MEPLIKHKGKVALLNRANVDTDQIIPKQFLKEIGKTGFGKNLFFDWRYLENGEPNPDFELNFPEYIDASILVTGDNFGCGSSREHAPWALLEYGFKIIISSGFADIFYSNCLKNGILPIVTKKKILDDLIVQASNQTALAVFFKVDLPNQTLTDSNNIQIPFEVDSFRKNFLLKGIDDIDWSLQFEKEIKEFEEKQKTTHSWLWR